MLESSGREFARGQGARDHTTHSRPRGVRDRRRWERKGRRGRWCRGGLLLLEAAQRGRIGFLLDQIHKILSALLAFLFFFLFVAFVVEFFASLARLALSGKEALRNGDLDDRVLAQQRLLVVGGQRRARYWERQIVSWLRQREPEETILLRERRRGER